jgi:tRNA A-37 threonylcarbamoyl transferase component Bud32
MIYCYECGEQVAKNDVFCPYCGISLSPQTAADDETNAHLSSPAETIPPQVQETDFADNATIRAGDFSNDVTADGINLKAGGISESEIAGLKFDSKPAGEYNEHIALSNPKPEKEFFEVPTPKIIEPVKTIEGTQVNKPQNFQNSHEQIFSDDGKAVDANPAELQNESSMMSYEEADVREVISPETPEVSVEETAAEAENIVKSSNFDVNDFDAKSEDVSEEYEMEQEFARAETSADLPLNTENSHSEQPIVMPAEGLPVEEKFPPTQFDSVSIMEKQETTEAKSSFQRNNFEPSQNIAKTGAASVASADERAFTKPNIGNGDTDGKNKQKLKPLDEGTVLNGRYEIVRKIGGGGMGAVYLASDKNLGGVLRAVKEMVQSYIEDEQQEKAVNDFKRESLLLTSLDHQSIPTIYDYFYDEKEARFYLVMKYISGGDLSSRLRSAATGRIDEMEVTKWAIQITDVLDYLHNRQPPIVYRDLKPANIMIDGNSGRTMLIDFGIARWVNKEEKGVTAVGTMGYAPPELFSGNVEARSDIYSLGSTMFHLLTGADPQSNPLLIFDFQKNPRPRQINTQLSDQMERILMRAVEYNADKRFASAAEMRRTLEDHLENLKKGAVTYGVKEAPASIALSDQPVFCGFCGQKIVATDMFCAFCGAKQPLAQQGVHSENYAPMPLTAQLLIIGTSELEQPSFRLEKEDNLVGRRDPQSNIFPEVDLSKYDPQTKISRRHARIWREGNEYMVEDLGSSNGTYILPVVSDTVRLQPRQPQLLTNGDKIRLGDTTLHFILG